MTNTTDAGITYRKRGDHTLLRYRRLGPVSNALPVVVVEDDPEMTMLYAAPDTPMKRRVLADGLPVPRGLSYTERSRLPHIVGDDVWKANHALLIFRPGDAHDIRLFWRGANWTFLRYYVNLQNPMRHVPVGFDTSDHVLDIVATPDRIWHWKDEDELSEAMRIGRFTETEAAAIRAEGERVISLIETGAWPFDGSLIDWRPDPTWTRPTIPDNWNEDPS